VLTRTVKTDVFLAPHPEIYDMLRKHGQMAQGGLNPFVKPGAFNMHVEAQEKAFEAALAKRTAEAKQK
jgi:metallo-beta-lactamase class B